MSNLLEGSIRTRNYAELLVERITESIVRGELKPGMKLPAEAEFAEKIGVGKSAVREAVNILRAFGIVEIKRGSGVYVAENFSRAMVEPAVLGCLLKDHERFEIADMKIQMQNMIIRILMERGDSDYLKQCCKDLCIGMLEEQSADEQLTFLAAYEEKICEGSGNRILSEICRSMNRICTGVQRDAVQRKIETGNALWFFVLYKEMTEALIKKNERKTQYLLASEYNALTAQASGTA